MWLFGVARNLLRNGERGEYRRSRLADTLREHLTVTTALPADSNSEMRDLIERLPPDIAEVVTLVLGKGSNSLRLRDCREFPRQQCEAGAVAAENSYSRRCQRRIAEQIGIAPAVSAADSRSPPLLQRVPPRGHLPALACRSQNKVSRPYTYG